MGNHRYTTGQDETGQTNRSRRVRLRVQLADPLTRLLATGSLFDRFSCETFLDLRWEQPVVPECFG